MNHQHRRTLEKVFSHPQPTDLAWSRIHGLFLALGASADHTSHAHTKFRLAGGPELSLPNPGNGQLASRDEVAKIHSFLRESGITPDHPAYQLEEADSANEQCLMVNLSHESTDIFEVHRGEADKVTIKPYDPWFHRHHLDHRHENTFAGQRSPEQPLYLEDLVKHCEAADHLLVIGHAHGQTDLRARFLDYIETHAPGLRPKITGVLTVSNHLSDAQLLEIGRAHFGMTRPR